MNLVRIFSISLRDGVYDCGAIRSALASKSISEQKYFSARFIYLFKIQITH